MAMACSAALLALTLFLEPINLAMEAVTPLPNPKESPRTRKKMGILKATAAMDSPPNRPIKIMSTMV